MGLELGSMIPKAFKAQGCKEPKLGPTEICTQLYVYMFIYIYICICIYVYIIYMYVSIGLSEG